MYCVDCSGKAHEHDQIEGDLDQTLPEYLRAAAYVGNGGQRAHPDAVDDILGAPGRTIEELDQDDKTYPSHDA